ncbi:MAG: S8 family serine peptidase [Candidatus Sericytochromatia bacterium]|nr:S8 family serine peptidase [Candidatus Tanganyikabacteria bacterium]
MAPGTLPLLGFSPPTIDDPLYAAQWFLPRIGVPEAWLAAAGRAFAPVTVAVLDSGIDVTHPDLAGRATLGPTFVAGTSSSADDFGHGTHVAGIIGARSGNGIGVAAVAPEVRLLAIKVLDARGGGTLAEVIAGLDAARAAGAKVVNMSFGTTRRSALLDQAIARTLAAGIVVVAAAGNDGTDIVHFPAATDGVIAVSAVDTADRRATFSSAGPQVRLAAPGVDIVSTGRGARYAIASGTSQAAPVVAGAIATVLAFRPWLGTPDLAALLHATGDLTTGFTQDIRRLDLTEAIRRALAN